MRGQDVLFSKGKDDWETPQWLFDELDKEFYLDVDAAAEKGNSKCVFFIKDALNGDWITFREPSGRYANCFCNPPYSKWQKFVAKAYEQNQKYNMRIVMLLPARTDTKAFHKYIYNNPDVEVRFLKGRLKFEIDGKPVLDKKHHKPQSAPFPSMIVIFKVRR